MGKREERSTLNKIHIKKRSLRKVLTIPRRTIRKIVKQANSSKVSADIYRTINSITIWYTEKILRYAAIHASYAKRATITVVDIVLGVYKATERSGTKLYGVTDKKLDFKLIK